jgi:hypothetical protein
MTKRVAILLVIFLTLVCFKAFSAAAPPVGPPPWICEWNGESYDGVSDGQTALDFQKKCGMRILSQTLPAEENDYWLTLPLTPTAATSLFAFAGLGIGLLISWAILKAIL